MPPLLLSTTSLYARVRKIHYRSLRRRLIQYLKLWFWFIIMPIANSYDGILCMIHHRDIYLFKKNYYELNGHFFYDVDMSLRFLRMADTKKYIKPKFLLKPKV